MLDVAEELGEIADRDESSPRDASPVWVSSSPLSQRIKAPNLIH